METFLFINYILGWILAGIICYNWREIVKEASKSGRRHVACVGMLSILLGVITLVFFILYIFAREALDSPPCKCKCSCDSGD